MIQWLKELLKRFLPPPVHAFNREVERILAAIGKQENVVEQTHRENQLLKEMLEHQEELLSQLAAALAGQEKALYDQKQLLLGQMSTLDDQEKQFAALAEGQKENSLALSGLGQLQKGIEKEQKEMVLTLDGVIQDRKKTKEVMEAVRKQATDGARHASEAVWAEIFNNTITESKWLKDRTFSPGRWAVGYPYLYVMYRVLNETHPNRILELGLGQSTRMIGQYAAAFDGVEHIVVEHDQEWIDFFCNDFSLSDRTKIVKLDREMVSYKDAEAVRVFKGFQETFAGQKFDFISIDAPLSGDMKQYARIDVLQLLPQCLNENFVIMIDDCERPGESHTVIEMEARLKESDLIYKKGKCSGKKDCVVIASEHMRFLTSM